MVTSAVGFISNLIIMFVMTIHLILDKTKRRKRDAVAQWKKPALRMLLNTTGATMT